MTNQTPADALFVVDEAERIVRGRVLPFGELSRQSVTDDPIEFSSEAIDVPLDPDVLTLNRDHNRFDPIGRAISASKDEAGVVADFRIARTPEGDAALADIRAGKVKALSAEVTGLVRNGAKALRSKLTGAALVPVGAFEGAALFAALGDVREEEPPTTTAQGGASGTSRAAATPLLPHVPEGGDQPVDIAALVEQLVTERLDGQRSPAAIDTEAAPVAEATAEAPAEADTKEDTMNAANPAVVPAGLNAPAAPKKDETTADGLFAAIAASKMGAPEALKPFQGGDALFAISTLQHSGPSTVTIGADVQQPAYLGELWKRRRYERRFVPLLAHSALTSYRAVGWQWDDGKEPTVGDYAGNTAEVPSNALDTKQLTMDAQRLAGGHSLDRRFIDFNDQGVISSYFDKMTESVSRQTDAKALAAIISSATPTAPGTVPAGIAKGLAAIVDGALDVLDTENDPGYALVDKALWREIVLTGKDDVLAFLTMSLGLDEGGLEGFKIRPATIGTAGNAGKQVIVGAKEAITFFELGGEAPIRVEGIDPHHGAINPAVFAYWATITSNAAAVRVVTVA